MQNDNDIKEKSGVIVMEIPAKKEFNLITLMVASLRI
jgi:hypothetical protein